MFIDEFILKIRKAETPFYARLKSTGKAVLTFHIPVPRALDPVYRAIVYLQYLRYETAERISVAVYRYPVLRMLCAQVGERLQMEQIPNISGGARVFIGDDVNLSGALWVMGGRVFPEPELRIGSRTFIGAKCMFSVAKSIEIGEDVLIAGGCSISDYSGHPLDPIKRAAGVQVAPEDVRPVRIGNKAWLGRDVVVLPGVTIGEGAVIGAATVVTKDVPPGHILVGSPGRLLARTVYDVKNDRSSTIESPSVL